MLGQEQRVMGERVNRFDASVEGREQNTLAASLRELCSEGPPRQWNVYQTVARISCVGCLLIAPDRAEQYFS